jgi:hypothetical protein
MEVVMLKSARLLVAVALCTGISPLTPGFAVAAEGAAHERT